MSRQESSAPWSDARPVPPAHRRSTRRPTAAGSPTTSSLRGGSAGPSTGGRSLGRGRGRRRLGSWRGFMTRPWSWSPTGAQLAYADVDELILLDPTTWERTTDRHGRRAPSARSRGDRTAGRSRTRSSPRPTGVSDAGSFGVFVVRSGSEPERVSDGLGTDGHRLVAGRWLPAARPVRERPERDRARRGGRIRRASAGGGSDARGAGGAGVVARTGVGSRSYERRGRRRVSHGDLGDRRGRAWWIRLGVGDSETWGGGPVWSPDSRRVAWSSFFGRDWVAADADGGVPRRSTGWRSSGGSKVEPGSRSPDRRSRTTSARSGARRDGEIASPVHVLGVPGVRRVDGADGGPRGRRGRA